MKRATLALSGALLLTSALALAQNGPESLLPPGFDRPAPRPAARPAEAAAPARRTVPDEPGATPVIQPVPVSGGEAAAPSAKITLPANLPPLDKLETMSPSDLAALLGMKPKFDIPPAARRAMTHIGAIDEHEGGLPFWSLGKQSPSLVRAVLAGNQGQMVSRWGHILMRRALASRLDAPQGMDPAEFAALRTALLVRMGEGEAARAIAQDVDPASYSPELVQAAIDAYVATADFTGACPIVRWQGNARRDVQWRLLQGICDTFAGEGSHGMTVLDRQGPGEGFDRIDLLLTQKYAGAAGKARRAVKIEWDGVDRMTPWRYGMTLAVGLEPPPALMKNAGLAYMATAATAPMLPLNSRAAAADVAGAAGILSSAAMVDLYSQIYATEGQQGDWPERSANLRAAYLSDAPKDRVAAIKALWGDGGDPVTTYSRQVLTAYAAARLPVSADYLDDAPGLIASMLSAGLDANALRWGATVPGGSQGWALLAVAAPSRAGQVDKSAIDDFHGADPSADQRKTRFLIAGLAALGRLPTGTAQELATQYGFELDRASRWSKLIDGAAEVGNPALVCLLAGAGMQGSGWDKMTARNLFHIVSALHRVGLDGEARMIAAEAVARG
ncbi:MAG: hypothetical protein ABI673_11265 [Novosphingobium sp.]